jgi:pimeloyl-ACP methyl ester carboxylesterase
MTQTGQQLATGYAPANEVDIYWESRGSGGTPLVLLHGGYGLASVFDEFAGQMSADRQVIVLELQGHGHTADIDRAFTWDDFGDDVATGALLRQDYDWSAEVGQLDRPVLLVYGDADSIPPSHAAEFYALLGGGQRDADWDGSLPTPSQLAIVPGRTHYNIGDSPLLPAMIAEFCGPSAG